MTNFTFNVLIHVYVDKSHNLALISAEQEARIFPIASNIIPVTAPVCPMHHQKHKYY
jgi:hypothetical protein